MLHYNFIIQNDIYERKTMIKILDIKEPAEQKS